MYTATVNTAQRGNSRDEWTVLVYRETGNTYSTAATCAPGPTRVQVVPRPVSRPVRRG